MTLSTSRRIRISFLCRQILPTQNLQVNFVQAVQSSGGTIEFFPQTLQLSRKRNVVNIAEIVEPSWANTCYRRAGQVSLSQSCPRAAIHPLRCRIYSESRCS